MKFQDFIVPLLFAFLGTWLIQHFFMHDKGARDIQPGSEFSAPISRQVRPLNYDIDFIDNEEPIDKKVSEIDTDYGTVTFSNYGAGLTSLQYKNIFTDSSMSVETIDHQQDEAEQKEDTPFLVALDGIGSTPYFYRLSDKQETDSFTSLTYTTETDQAVITKEFFVYKSPCKVDLNLTIDPKVDKSVSGNISESPLQARLLLPAPYVSRDKYDYVKGLVYTDRNTLVKKTPKEITQKGWMKPYIFGAENRYFVNSLVKDLNGFVSRAYFKPDVSSKLMAILESPEIKQKTTWSLSFYLGPKKSSYLSTVDKRLEEVIGYGYFGFVSKPLLYLLNWLYSFLHNYGLAIIALGILINLILLPIMLKGAEAQKKSADMQRKLKYLEQKYKHDPDTLNREKLELIKRHGGGTLFSMFAFLPQIPIFIGLNRVLSSAIELYGANFLWIDNLSNADPYYILPALFSVGMIMSMVTGPSTGVKDARQGLSMGIFAIILGALFANFASGLVLYFVVNVWFRVFQNYIQKYSKKLLSN